MEQKQPAPIYAPLATKERFAYMTGLEEGVIRGMIDKGHLPTVKVGKYRLINLALLHDELCKEVWEK
jgi:hypothetical protein